MARLRQAFAAARAEGWSALVVYWPVGLPSPRGTADAVLHLIDAGADVLELGVPFSDPLADGPVLQRAAQRALAEGTTWVDVVATVRAVRGATCVPIVIFSYLNPLWRAGLARALAEVANAGAEGVLLVDAPVGVDPDLDALLARGPLARVPLVAPTTAPARRPVIAQAAEGFLYCLSRTGVTGTHAGPESIAREVADLRGLTAAPIAVGFGIAQPEDAARVGRWADGVVVGSAVVDAWERGGMAAAVDFVRALRTALRTGDS